MGMLKMEHWCHLYCLGGYDLVNGEIGEVVTLH